MEMSKVIREIQPYWTVVRPYLLIRDEEDYDRAIEQMNEMIDIVGADEDHPMYEFLDTLGTLIHAYEEEHYPMPQARGVEVLR
jgi:HTH-type transcriptional regulator/antitoxin HigA